MYSLGVDVSHWQDEINWQQVKQEGVTFALIKASQSTDYRDERFFQNWVESHQAGVLRGAYHFFTIHDDPIQQAENLFDTVSRAQLLADLPPAVDVEPSGHPPDYYVNHANEYMGALKTCVERIEALFRIKPLIYTNVGIWNSLYTVDDWAAEYPLWVAHWGVDTPTLPRGWQEWMFWQFSNRGVVAGIHGRVDQDHFNGSLEDLHQYSENTRWQPVGSPIPVADSSDVVEPAPDDGDTSDVSRTDWVEVGLNLDPDSPLGQPGDYDVLKGIEWARFVFQASDKHKAVEESFPDYAETIARCQNLGAKVLMILNWQTYKDPDAVPWIADDENRWTNYYAEFAEACGKIAQHYRAFSGEIAYEIWNEGDQKPEDQDEPTSVYIAPDRFAKLLTSAVDAIRHADPNAKICFGGLTSGAMLGYAQAVEQACLEGKLPIDAIGLHPYRGWPDRARLVPPGWHPLSDLLEDFIRVFPNKSLWITEFSYPSASPEGYEEAARYMQAFYELVSERRYRNHIGMILWYGWSDGMKPSFGLVEVNSRSKLPIMQKFQELARR